MEIQKMNKKSIDNFAARIKDWNQKDNRLIVIFIVAYLILLTLYSLVINVREVMGSQVLLLINALIVLSMLGLMYVLWFIKSYITVNGRDGKVFQGLVVSLEYMPFSLEEYIQYVHGRLKQTFWGIGFASFVITFLGCFGYCYYDIEAEKTNIILVDIDNVSQILGFVAIAALETAFLLVMMNLCFCLYRYLLFRMYTNQKENGRIRKGRDDNQEYRIQEKKKQYAKFGKVALCVLLLMAVVFFGISVLSDEAPLFVLGLYVTGIVGVCVKYWFFSIPVIGLIVISVLAILNKKMVASYGKEAGGKEKPIDDRKLQKARIILWWFLLAAIAIIGIPLLLCCCYDLHYGAYSVYEIKSGLLTGGTAFMLLFLALALGLGRHANEWNKGKLVRKIDSQNEERDSFETRLNVNLITGILAISVVVVSAFFYQCFTPDGVEVRRFSNVKSYTWEDVESYTFRAKLGGYLAIDFEMVDGEKVSYKELGTSCTSDGYEDRIYLYEDRFASKTQDTLSGMGLSDYYNSTETYIMWITAKLAENGANCKTTDWEELEKELRGEYSALVFKLQEIVE